MVFVCARLRKVWEQHVNDMDSDFTVKQIGYKMKKLIKRLKSERTATASEDAERYDRETR
jgi:hypothetical protein